jgi:hypothetical protein
MASKTKVTTDHEEIRRWVEERGGSPAAVKRTSADGEPGILRIDFPGYTGEGTLEHIPWDDWFRKFDENKLAFLYQQETSGGARSNFNKLIGRDTAQTRAQGVKRHRPARTTTGRSSTAGRSRTAGRRSTRSRTRAVASTRNARPSSSRSSKGRSTAVGEGKVSERSQVGRRSGKRAA